MLLSKLTYLLKDTENMKQDRTKRIQNPLKETKEHRYIIYKTSLKMIFQSINTMYPQIHIYFFQVNVTQA